MNYYAYLISSFLQLLVFSIVFSVMSIMSSLFFLEIYFLFALSLDHLLVPMMMNHSSHVCANRALRVSLYSQWSKLKKNKEKMKIRE